MEGNPLRPCNPGLEYPISLNKTRGAGQQLIVAIQRKSDLEPWNYQMQSGWEPISLNIVGQSTIQAFARDLQPFSNIGAMACYNKKNWIWYSPVPSPSKPSKKSTDQKWNDPDPIRSARDSEGGLCSLGGHKRKDTVAPVSWLAIGALFKPSEKLK